MCVKSHVSIWIDNFHLKKKKTLIAIANLLLTPLLFACLVCCEFCIVIKGMTIDSKVVFDFYFHWNKLFKKRKKYFGMHDSTQIFKSKTTFISLKVEQKKKNSKMNIYYLFIVFGFSFISSYFFSSLFSIYVWYRIKWF